MSSIFIDVQLSVETAADPGLGAQLEEVCPVGIFRAGPSSVVVVDENVDECILCELCVRTAAPGGVRVVKRYDAAATLERS